MKRLSFRSDCSRSVSSEAERCSTLSDMRKTTGRWVWMSHFVGEGLPSSRISEMILQEGTNDQGVCGLERGCDDDDSRRARGTFGREQEPVASGFSSGQATPR